MVCRLIASPDRFWEGVQQYRSFQFTRMHVLMAGGSDTGCGTSGGPLCASWEQCHIGTAYAGFLDNVPEYIIASVSINQHQLAYA